MKDKCPYYEENCGNCVKKCAKLLAYEETKKDGVIEKTLSELNVNINMPTWDLLMGMQKQFAKRFHKVDNLTKNEMDHWINAYLVCIEDEIREVREHLDIYPDLLVIKENSIELEKEFIDIIHFIMDEFISGGANSDDIKNAYLKKYYENENIDDLMNFAYNKQKEKIKKIYEGYPRDYTILLLVNKLLDCSGKVRQQISWKHWKKATETINLNKLNEAFAETFKILIDIYCIMDMTPEKIRDIYIKKNVENILRQKFGYL